MTETLYDPLIDSSEGFYRTPSPYVHDAFAHDGKIDGCTRVRPHSGADGTISKVGAQARSILGGRVIERGFTIYAGQYALEQTPVGLLALYLHFDEHGDAVATDVGTALGVAGNTGGGGSGPLGRGKMGKHVHVSLCRDRAAVDRILNGRVRARLVGETPAQWAAAHGLVDPWPYIIDAKKRQDARRKAQAEAAAAAARVKEYRQKEQKMIPVLIRVDGKDYLTQLVTGKSVLVTSERDRQSLDAAIKATRAALERGESTVELGPTNGARWRRYLDALAAA